MAQNAPGHIPIVAFYRGSKRAKGDGGARPYMGSRSLESNGLENCREGEEFHGCIGRMGGVGYVF